MKKIIITIIASLLLPGTCLADNSDIIDTDELQSAVPESAEEILETSSVDDAGDTDGLLSKLLKSLKSELSNALKPALRRGTIIFIIAVICSVFEIFASDSSPLYLKLCAFSGIVAVCFGDADSYINLANDALNSISEFSKALLPTLCAAGIVCGTPAAAAAKYAASALFMDIFIEAAQTIIIPAIFAYTALVIANSCFKNKLLEGMSSLLKWLCTTLMVALTIIFTTYLSLSAVIASGGDAVASKAAKTAISTLLPVVGSIASDAASTVVAGAETVRSLIGVFGVVIILAVCITPFAVLGINYLILKAVSAFSGAFNRNSAALISGIANSLGMLLSMVGCAGIMLFISIISCIKAVSA